MSALCKGRRLRHQANAPRPAEMVLVGDIVGDDEAAVAKAPEVVRPVQCAQRGRLHRSQRGDAQEISLDRSRTAAIAKHTNAFKINEDVVILPRYGDVRWHRADQHRLVIRSKLRPGPMP
ncbi:MAG: hypothetical protein IPN40_09170 [Uliginosibacterium sp.]|nr:hypothetical protein [Uliginosibacterium sp.]